MIDRIGEDSFANQHERIVHLQLVDIILPQLERAVNQAVNHSLLGAVQRVYLTFSRIQRRFHDHTQAQLLGLFD